MATNEAVAFGENKGKSDVYLSHPPDGFATEAENEVKIKGKGSSADPKGGWKGKGSSSEATATLNKARKGESKASAQYRTDSNGSHSRVQLTYRSQYEMHKHNSTKDE